MTRLREAVALGLTLLQAGAILIPTGENWSEVLERDLAAACGAAIENDTILRTLPIDFTRALFCTRAARIMASLVRCGS